MRERSCVNVANVLELSSSAHGMDGIFHFKAKERGCARNLYFFVIYCVVFVSILNIQESPFMNALSVNYCPNYQL